MINYKKTLRKNFNRIAYPLIAYSLFSSGQVFAATSGAYVTSNSRVLVINTSNNVVVGTVTITSSPATTARFLAASPDGDYVYVTNSATIGNNDTVSVIDTSLGTIIATVAVGPIALGIAISPDDSYCYVANNNNGTVSVFSTLDYSSPTAPVAIGSDPSQIAITPDSSYAYISDVFDRAVYVMSTLDYSVPYTFNYAGTPRGIALSTIRGTVYGYVAIEASDSVSVIDGSTFTLIGTVSLSAGSQPFGIAITPNTYYAYVTNRGSNNVSVINTLTNNIDVYRSSIKNLKIEV